MTSTENSSVLCEEKALQPEWAQALIKRLNLLEKSQGDDRRLINAVSADVEAVRGDVTDVQHNVKVMAKNLSEVTTMISSKFDSIAQLIISQQEKTPDKKINGLNSPDPVNNRDEFASVGRSSGFSAHSSNSEQRHAHHESPVGMMSPGNGPSPSEAGLYYSRNLLSPPAANYTFNFGSQPHYPQTKGSGTFMPPAF